MVDDARIGMFLDDVASERVTPAGGTVVAISAAMGAALCEMACLHTVAAREEDANPADAAAANGDEFEAICNRLSRQRRRLLALATQDARLVDDLFGGGAAAAAAERGGSSSRPTTPPDRLSKRAVGIPLATAEASMAILEDAAVIIERGRPSVVADARSGAYLADAGVQASLATVDANLTMLTDAGYAARIERRCAEIADVASEVRRTVFASDSASGGPS